MRTDDKIRDEKLQYYMNRSAVKILTLLSGEVDKCEYLTCENISLFNKSQTLDKAEFTNSPLGKTMGKRANKQVDISKSLNLYLK